MGLLGRGNGGSGGGLAPGHSRQEQGESRAPVQLAGDGDFPGVQAHDIPAHREPEAGAAAEFLGRKKRFENVFELVGRDAAAVVLNLDAQALAAAVRRRRFRDPHRDAPGPAHGVQGIVQQVQK